MHGHGQHEHNDCIGPELRPRFASREVGQVRERLAILNPRPWWAAASHSRFCRGGAYVSLHFPTLRRIALARSPTSSARVPTRRTGTTAPPPRQASARKLWIALIAALIVSGAARGFRLLNLSFLSDDYLILDKVWWRNFVQLWWRDYNIFGWFRPWSREIHFWSLYHLAGLDVRPYHAVSLLLWLAVLILFSRYAWREAGPAAAIIGTTGLAALASWGAPLAWIAGCQELWLCVWTLAYLHALSRRQDLWALGGLALALLSKETAVALPVIGAAYVAFVRRDPPRAQLRRFALDAGLALAWFFWHPTLLPRLLHRGQSIGDRLSSPWLAIPYSVLSFFNLEVWPHPEGEVWAVLAQGAWRILPLLAIAFLSLRAPRPERGPAWRGRVLFAATWVAIGVGGLLTPTIGWHSYYALLAALGAWLLLGQVLERARWPAVALLSVVIVLEPLRAETPSWDWSSFAYQERAAIFGAHLRESLLQQVPTAPPHSRLYFAEIPRNIGFVTADGPAFRVLYRDSTLRGWFIGEYRPRAASEPSGSDIFLRFDGTVGLRRMVPASSPPAAVDSMRNWESDQRLLAWEFGRGGDWRRAAEQFVALGHARPSSVEYAANAGDCYRRAGEPALAEVWADRAKRLGLAPPPAQLSPRPPTKGIDR